METLKKKIESLPRRTVIYGLAASNVQEPTSEGNVLLGRRNFMRNLSVGAAFPDATVYVNNQLTKHNKHLMWMAKERARKEN